MSDNVIQASFAAGELSPSLLARVDFAKYRSGAATMRNFFVDYRSGASTRTGTEYIRPGAFGSSKIRIVRFQQSNNVSYVLEFGDHYLRFISDGASIVNPAASVTAVNLGVQTSIVVPGAAFGPALVFTSGGNIPQMNGRYFLSEPAGGNVYVLVDPFLSESVDSSAWPAYTGGMTVQDVYTISTPYSADELSLLKFSQNANTMNITHPNHPPYILTLFSATNWTLVPATIGPSVDAPSGVSAVPTSGGAVAYKYTVTAVDANGQEGPPGPVAVIASGVDLRTVVGTNVINWAGVPGAQFYNVYGSSPSYEPLQPTVGGLGFIGSVDGNTFNFNDSNIAPDFSKTPPVHDDPFVGVNPQVSSYFQQRLIYGNGGGNLVQTFWASKTGAPYNFDISNPSQADDAITGALVSLEVNDIKSMVPMPSGLIILTAKGAWQLSGGAGGVATQGGPITPSTITATPQAYVGANDVPPILVNYDILFVQAKGSIIRDLTYNIYANIYTGTDITVLSSHMFYGHQTLEWAYAEEPFKIVWCVRDDGVALSLTAIKEQDMYGWARHDTRGNFKSVCTVTEGQTDATYFVVERFFNDHPVLYIERLADRAFTYGSEDAWCVDCGAKTGDIILNATLEITIVTAGKVVIQTDVPAFGPGEVGMIVRAGGGIFKIETFLSDQALECAIIQPPTNLVANDPTGRIEWCPPGTWTLNPLISTIYGLDHLEGQEISVLADGGVVNGLVVQDGSVTLPAPASKVIAGYGFQAQLQTMYLDLGNETNSVQGKRKKVGALTVRVKDSRGAKAGMTFNTVTPIKELNRAYVMGLPILLVTSDERIVMDPLWDVPGQICIQVDDPLPVTVLGVVPEIVIGDTPK